MAEYDEGKKRSNGVTDGDEEGVRGPIEVEHDPVTPGGGETLYSVFRDFFAGVVSPPPPALLQRIKSSASESAPRLQEASRNSARNLCLWTRRGGTLRALFVISVCRACRVWVSLDGSLLVSELWTVLSLVL